jgi:CheY-like chemotaxis protein
MRQSEFSGSGSSDQVYERFRGISILVVDDNRDVRETLRDIFQAYSAEVTVAGCAQQGREVILFQPPDLLVSDIRMPDEDGLQFIASVRQLVGNRHLPAVAVSGNVSDADRRRALAAGFDVFVPKPFDLADILGAVEVLLPRILARRAPSAQRRCR